MKTLKIDDATAPLRDYARALDKEGVVLTEDGKPVAALVAIDDADWETVALSTNPDFIALIQRSRARRAAEGGLAPNAIRRRLASEG